MPGPAHRTAPRVPHPPGLDLRTAADHRTYILSVVGDLDLSGLDTLRAAIVAATRSPCSEIVVDLGGCTFIDSAGVGALLQLDRTVRDAAGRTLTILPGPRQVQRVFEVSGLLRVLPFAE